jgi:anaerobic magnesium-protoporphyrin IX monomethyl ester cyclase
VKSEHLNIGLINIVPDEDSPPMNLVALGSYLKKTGINVRIIDSTYERGAFSRQVNDLDLIGISSMTPSYSKAIKLAKQLRKSYDKPIIIGGPHISLIPESFSANFTAGVIGEGEEVLSGLCSILKESGTLPVSQLSEIPGLAYRYNETIKINEQGRQIQSLDNLPFPEFSFLNRRYFRKRWIDWSGKVGASMHISTSRGCPYHCIFCSGQRLWQKVRFQSAERIISEVNELVTKYSVDHIVIDDDLFLSNKRRLEELSEILGRAGLSGKVAILCSARSNLIDEDMCRILKSIGVRALNFGFESGSEKILKYLKGENVTVNQNMTAIELCRKYGFEVSGNLILGSPGETIDDMMETIDFMDFAIRHGCYKVGVFVLTPLPGTPVWKLAIEKKLVGENMDWDMLSFYDYKDPMFLGPDINKEDFETLFQAARKNSYRGWLRNRWWKMLMNDYRRVIRKVVENPGRAGVMLRSILMNKGNRI